MQQEDPEAEIFEAFQMTDKQKRGFIQASELRAKLTMLGEKLTNKEGIISWWISSTATGEKKYQYTPQNKQVTSNSFTVILEEKW